MKLGRKHFLVLTVAVATGLPLPSSACEPILPLTQLMSGGTLAGPGLILQSVTWLCIAVLIKTGSFALLERRFSTSRAIGLMLAANIISTIPGLLTAVFAGALSLLTLPFVYLLGRLAERRISSLTDDSAKRRFIGKGLAIGFTTAFFVSVVMFSLAGNALAGP